MTTVTTAPQAAVSTWTIDAAHSNVEFSVKHMMIATVKGRFGAVEGTFAIDQANPERSRIEASVETASVETGLKQRDDHLRSDDFFNAAAYPKLSFVSTKIERHGDGWKMTGDLTIRDISRPVVLDVELEGRGRDAFSKDRAGFIATGKINRKDFGVNWNGAIEAGGVVVSDTVKITLNIAAVRQDAASVQVA